MAFPPVPESPNRQLPGRSSGTPRVGMHLYQDDDEDDDVSVLTFHTLGTRDTHTTGGSNSSFVKTARESLERMISENKKSGEDDGRSLTRISEESGSRSSSYNSNSRSSSRSSCSCNSKSGSSKSSSVKSDQIEKIDEGNYDNGDDDTHSLAESILDSANKVLANIGSSPYYTGRNKKLSSPAYESPMPRPDSKQPPPAKRSTKKNETVDNRSSEKMYSTKKEFNSSNKMSSDHDNQLEVSSNFLSSYFTDENAEPSANHANHSKHNTITAYRDVYKSNKAMKRNQNLQQLESETMHLQRLLKEKQLKTKKASQNLGTSIKKAHELLRKYDDESTM